MLQFEIALLLAVVTMALLRVGRRPYRHELNGPWRRLLGTGSLALVLAMIVFLPVTSGGDEQLSEPEKIWFPLLLVGHVIIVGFLGLWWLLRTGPQGPFLHLSWRGLRGQIQYGVLAGVAGWGITVTVTTAAVALAVGSGAMSQPEAPPAVMLWLAQLPLLRKLAIIGAAMTAEEAFFRGFLQPRFGLVPSSILFAMAHFSYGLPFLVLGVFSFSIVVGVTFARRGELLPCVIAHGVFDAIQLIIVLPLVSQFWPHGVIS